MKGAIFRAGLAAACLAGLAGCSSSSTSGEGTGSTLRNLVMYGGLTVPPAKQGPEFLAHCPPVDVFEGGSVTRVGGAQVAIGQLARECGVNEDGSVTVKVGVEGRALLASGAGGAGGGRLSAPLRVLIKYGDRVIASRARAVGVAIPPGEAQALFSVVEEGILVPAQYAGEYDIEVGFGSGSGATAKPQRRAAR